MLILEILWGVINYLFIILIFLGIPLCYAIMEGQTNAVQALFDNNSDINSQDNNLDSLLYFILF
jgi:hypothetical protein